MVMSYGAGLSGVRGPVTERAGLDGTLLELASFALGQPTPDAEALVVGQGILQALGPDVAAHTDLLGLPGGAALLGEERLGIGLRAERAFLPGQLDLVLGDVGVADQ